jgi:RNA polymerase sigma factor (sigma-70 family)
MIKGNLRKTVLISGQSEIGYAGNITDVILEPYLPRVFRYISYWVNRTATAEDLTLRVLKKALPGFKSCCTDEDSLSVWILAIARDEVRGYNGRYAGNKAMIYEKAGPPNDGSAGGRSWDQLQAGLKNLTPPEKEIIALKLGAELSNHCIARIMGISDSEVGMGLCQALKKLNGSLL